MRLTIKDLLHSYLISDDDEIRIYEMDSGSDKSAMIAEGRWYESDVRESVSFNTPIHTARLHLAENPRLIQIWHEKGGEDHATAEG